MSVEELAERRPAFILAPGKLRAEKKVVFSRVDVEGGRRTQAEWLLARSEMAPAHLSESWRFRNIGRPRPRTPANAWRSAQRSIPSGQSGPVSGIEKPASAYVPPTKSSMRGYWARAAGWLLAALEYRPGSGSDGGRSLRRGGSLSSGLELELALWPAPTTSHTAQPLRPKLPGISSRFLLETMQYPVASTQTVSKPRIKVAAERHPGASTGY